MVRAPVLVLLLCLGLSAASIKKTKSKARLAKRLFSQACDVNEFQCENGHCIQAEWTCDTERDCRDGSDELNCAADCSGEHQVKCNNGNCVPLEYRCDGDDDCGDGSDEAGCNDFKCSVGEVHCVGGQNLCVEEAWLCDGDNDCQNGWDEDSANCKN